MSSDTLQVIRKNNYEYKLPSPTIVGFFCIDKNRQFLPTSENLKYLYEYATRVNFNLNDGYDCFVPKDQQALNDEKLKHILRWIDYNNYLDKLSKKKVCNSSNVNRAI